jgi:small subunit ribosomal protein S16
MSVSIKLARVGSKNSPYYRIVVAPTKSKRDGKNLGVIGRYDPKLKTHELDKGLFDEWTKKGAILTVGVKKVLGLNK